MFDAMTPNDSYWFNTTDSKASDRAAVRYGLAMTAAMLVFTFSAVIARSAAFPAGLEVQPFLTAQPMPLL